MPIDEYISARFSGIDVLISSCKKWGSADEQLSAHLAAYVCVVLSGAIEDAIERMISLRMETLVDKATGNYVVKVVGQRFRNPDWGAINRLLGDFSEQFKLTWTSRFPSGGRLDQSLQSINNIKNHLAHKGSNSLPVTIGDVQAYFEEVLPAMDHLEEIIVPTSSS